MQHLLRRNVLRDLWRLPSLTRARLSTVACAAATTRFTLASQETSVDLTFTSEPLGLSSKDGFGWPQFQFGQAIGPNGRYTIARKLGWGMHSSTWLARDNVESSYVAVKAMTGIATSLLQTGMIIWEPEALRVINGGRGTPPYCLELMREFEIEGVGADGRHHCFVTPVYGGDVKVLQREAGEPFPLRLSKRILLHLLRGLVFSHSRSIVHTDLKHDNIFYNTTLTTAEIENWLTDNPPQYHPPERSKDGMVQSAVSQRLPVISIDEALTRTYVLADFSCALPTIACGHGRIVTAPGFRAPEVYLAGEWNKKADIWSFGCLVFEIVTGTKLFRYKVNEGTLRLTETEYILLQMICLNGGENFGPELLNVCELASEYFREDCSLKKDPPRIDIPFQLRIERFPAIVPPDEVMPMADLMRRCLALDPTNRASAEELLKDPWFEGVE